MSKKNKKKRFLRPRIVIPSIFFLALLIFVYLALPVVSASILKNVFQKGTGCDVSVAHPRINFNLPSASVSDVKILCESEIEGQGFSADKVEVKIDLSDLLARRIIISSLSLTGAKAFSLNENSSFLKTLQFVLTKPDTKKKSFWHVWVPEVTIETAKNSDTNFIFGENGNFIRFNKVKFSSLDAVDRPETGVIMEAIGEGGEVSFSDNSLLKLQEVKMLVEAKDGLVKFTKVEVKQSTADNSAQLATVTGYIVNQEKAYFLDLASSVNIDQLKEVFLRPELLPIEANLEISGNLRGTFSKPEISVDLISHDTVIEEKKDKSSIKFNSNAKLEYREDFVSLAIKFDESTTELVMRKSGPSWNFVFSGDEKMLSSKKPTLVNGSVNFGREELSIQRLNLHEASVNKIIKLKRLFLEKEYYPDSDPINRSYDDFALTSEGSVSFGEGYVLADANLNLFLRNEGGELLNVKTAGNAKNANLQVFGKLDGKQVKTDVTIKQGKLSGALEINDFDIQKMPYVSDLLKSGTHRANLNLNLAGEIENPKIEGLLRLVSTEFGESDISDMNLSWAKESWSLKGSLFGSKNQISVAKNPNNIIELKYDVPSLPITYFLKHSMDSKVFVSGAAELTQKSMNLGSLDGNVNLTAIDFGKDYEEFRPASPVSLKINSGILNFNNSFINVAGLGFYFNGTYGFDKGIDLKVAADGSVPDIFASALGMESVSGKLKLSAFVKGPNSKPEIQGQVVLSEGIATFRLANGISGIENMQAVITFSGNDLEISNFRGVFGDGDLKLNGRIFSFLDSKFRNGQINLVADNILLEPFTGLATRIESEMSLLVIPNSSPVLKGDIVLTEAVYQKEISIQMIVSQITDFILGRSHSRLEQKKEVTSGNNDLKLNLRARTAQGLLINTNVLQAEVDADLSIEGNYAQPRVLGNIETIDGNFKINQTNFQILSGSMSFNGSSEINPSINLSSEGDLRKRTGETEKIFLNVSGPLDATKVIFSSDGSTPPKDIVRQLGIGGNQFVLVKADRRSIGYREVLSPSSDLSLSERFSGLTGFDSIKLETVPSIRTGEFIPQVQASRPLPYNLRGMLWSEVSGDRANGARVEYKLYDDISLFYGWRSQSVLEPSSANTSNFITGFSFRDTFKGLSFFENRVKRSD